jgi:hypothetical protein
VGGVILGKLLKWNQSLLIKEIIQIRLCDKQDHTNIKERMNEKAQSRPLKNYIPTLSEVCSI